MYFGRLRNCARGHFDCCGCTGRGCVKPRTYTEDYTSLGRIRRTSVFGNARSFVGHHGALQQVMGPRTPHGPIHPFQAGCHGGISTKQARGTLWLHGGYIEMMAITMKDSSRIALRNTNIDRTRHTVHA